MSYSEGNVLMIDIRNDIGFRINLSACVDCGGAAAGIHRHFLFMAKVDV